MVAGSRPRTARVASGSDEAPLDRRPRREIGRSEFLQAATLLLDEPTNDLDVDTLRALEEALLQFAGYAVVISHDRWFLDRVATHIMAFEGNSKVTWFEGNYQDYEAWRHEQPGVDADQPHRMHCKKLTN